MGKVNAPDIVIAGGRVLTMDLQVPRAEAFAITGGLITAMGTSDEMRALAGPHTRLVEAGGRTVLPGLIDSHVHLFQGAAELDYLPVGGVESLDAIRPMVHEYTAARPDEPLVLCTGAFHGLWEGVASPRKALDDILPDRPFALLAADLHAVWANTMTLEKAGLLNGAPMPEGSIVVIGSDGKATGALLEAGAMGPVLAMSRTGGRDMAGYVTGANPKPKATAKQREADKALLLKGIAHAAAHGITTLHNMDGNFYLLELLSELEAEDRLTARVQVPFHLKNFDSLDRLEEAAEMHRRFASDMVWSGRVKMFMDGVMETRTALMSRPYPDSPGNTGEALYEPGHFNEACVRSDAMGLQLSVHAIGDLAVSRVLDGYAAARQANGARDARHRIEHVELIAEPDIARMKALDAVASMQPRHAAFGGFFAPPEPDTVFFPEQHALAYPWRTLREAGVPLAFSTDWPVVPVDALANLQSAVAPVDLGPSWPDQRIELLAALDAYTRMNAWLGFREGREGRIIQGLSADVVILGGDIEATSPDDIGGLDIAMTICNGRISYESGAI